MKRTHSLKRIKDNLETNKAYLVLTEDSHSSKLYVDGLIRYLGHNIRRFELRCPGSSPKNIREAAQKELKNFDEIFCIFDRDSHDSKGGHYTALMNWARTQDNVLAINSVPCFEYWIYLHFKYSDRPLSTSDATIKLLSKELKGYEKGLLNFSSFKDKLDTAVAHSKKSIARSENDGSDDPTTKMGEFVEHLKGLSK